MTEQEEKAYLNGISDLADRLKSAYCWAKTGGKLKAAKNLEDALFLMKDEVFQSHIETLIEEFKSKQTP